jgi:DNA topoisomerase-1
VQIVLFDGFMRVYTESKDDATEEDTSGTLPPLKEDDAITVSDITPLQHFTQPPARYSDATLVKALEAHGIGRPSTYAPTISTLQERGYVEKIEKRFHPTEVAFLVVDMLVNHFPDIVDVDFTAQVEEELDHVAEGKEEWTKVCKEFYEPFKERLKKKEKEVEKQVEVSDTPCPHCGNPMLIKFGRMGKFLACPEGEKVTLPMPEEAAQIKELEEKTKDEKCPECGSAMDVKRGRFGFFLACSRYPECKGTSRIWDKTGFLCPACKDSTERADKPGDIVLKKSRGRGKPFYACTRWPDCQFIANKKPESEEELQELYGAWQEKEKEDKTRKNASGVHGSRKKTNKKTSRKKSSSKKK